jgi:Na+/melibiose symporter-like transporter
MDFKERLFTALWCALSGIAVLGGLLFAYLVWEDEGFVFGIGVFMCLSLFGLGVASVLHWIMMGKWFPDFFDL